MVDPIDDIARQARQGSVAAIIQVLNEKLANTGVRTRAMLADGILQILCEAATPAQLEQDTLVEQIRQILEAIAPRNIRRVNINSRIVREQQLLWLEEISRDPQNQLLWSQEIILKKSNFFRHLAEDFKERKPTKGTPPLPQPSSRLVREKRQFWRGLVGGASLSLLVFLVGWALYGWLGSTFKSWMSLESQNSVSPSSSAPATSDSPTSQMVARTSDPFAEAVRIAEQAANAGKTAESSAQWLDLAAKWQRASDLMSAVPASDMRYKTAQDRVESYRQKSLVAQQEAQRRR